MGPHSGEAGESVRHRADPPHATELVDDSLQSTRRCRTPHRAHTRITAVAEVPISDVTVPMSEIPRCCGFAHRRTLGAVSPAYRNPRRRDVAPTPLRSIGCWPMVNASGSIAGWCSATPSRWVPNHFAEHHEEPYDHQLAVDAIIRSGLPGSAFLLRRYFAA